MGVSVCKYSKLSESLKDCNTKLRGTTLSLNACGVGEANGLHPLSCKKIYKSVILPKGLYGCELWYNLTDSEILFLERSHRFCVKYIQCLSKRTRTDIALGLLEVYSMTAEIDKRKMVLFGQFCRLNIYSRAKDIFLLRLASFYTADDHFHQNGYFSDIFKVLDKYGLDNYMLQYYSNGTFPSKLIWKSLINAAIKRVEESSWYDRIYSDDFSMFQHIQPLFGESFIWTLCRYNSNMSANCRNVIDMISRLSRYTADKLCSRCGDMYNDEVLHCII